MRGKCQGFVLCRQTWQCNENITDCGGKRAVVLPTGCPRSAGLLAGICRTKVKSPRYSLGVGGPWLQMTSALLGKHSEAVSSTECILFASNIHYLDQRKNFCKNVFNSHKTYVGRMWVPIWGRMHLKQPTPGSLLNGKIRLFALSLYCFS